MSSDWAAKLANVVPPSTDKLSKLEKSHTKKKNASLTPPPSTTTATAAIGTTMMTRATAKSPSPSTSSSTPTKSSLLTGMRSTTPTNVESCEFNSKELLEYFDSEYKRYLNEAKKDKDGEVYKIYKSLESSNQWTTKLSSNLNKNFGPKNVFRNSKNNGEKKDSYHSSENGFNGPNVNTVDILFELNRSIYQQRTQSQSHSQNS
ncbi:hypothetical protein KGF56_004328 [Candida oxycetoniae]|uniref:Uncharacterized protein n=1 Tax=Candida oxycetoniae TaxID=497107 RepID=A0AAI9STR9_9ASCO|nr:uncharacterized protein KGF56_004328 [Candida oxycetoniae]KAI3402867.2 hypothetical protein KGF56_004328 [Candida oxycetoniae]